MLDSSLIKVDLALESQKEVFQYLANLVVDNGYANDSDKVIQALFEREAEGTTGMMDGYAIPHAKTEAILNPCVCVLKLQKGIDWQSMDGNPTKYVIGLFVPDNQASTTHLQLLSKIARLLMKNEFKAKFEQAKLPNEVMELLKEEMNEGDVSND